MRRKSTGKRLRFRVLEQCGFRCRYCGRSPNKDPNVILHVDHITPVAGGGVSREDNLIASCQDCNFGKTDTILSQRFWNSQPHFVPGSPFLTWLLAQVGREDRVGDLAKDVSQNLPHFGSVQSYREFSRLFREKAHYSAVGADWHAWREWNRGKPTLATAITIADGRVRREEDHASLQAEIEADRLPSKEVTQHKDSLAMETRQALRYLAVRWQGALDVGCGTDNRILSRAIKAVSAVSSPEDLLKVAKACPMYPKYGCIWLCGLAAAERDGRKISIVRWENGTIDVKISWRGTKTR